MKIESNFLVISDYYWLPEDINDSWVAKSTSNYLIYDRASRYLESEKVVHQKNVGQNVYDLFDFIITRYDDLPDVSIFTRAAIFYPKDNVPPLSRGNCSEENFFRLANSKEFTEIHDYGPEVHNGLSSKSDEDGAFYEKNTSWYFRLHPGRYFYSLNQFFKDVFKDPPNYKYVRFSPGVSYVIPKSYILKYPKYFYERMREYVSWGIIVGEAHMFERALYTIFTADLQVKSKYLRPSKFKSIDLFFKQLKVQVWNMTIRNMYLLSKPIVTLVKNLTQR